MTLIKALSKKVHICFSIKMVYIPDVRAVTYKILGARIQASQVSGVRASEQHNQIFYTLASSLVIQMPRAPLNQFFILLSDHNSQSGGASLLKEV